MSPFFEQFADGVARPGNEWALLWKPEESARAGAERCLHCYRRGKSERDVFKADLGSAIWTFRNAVDGYLAASQVVLRRIEERDLAEIGETTANGKVSFFAAHGEERLRWLAEERGRVAALCIARIEVDRGLRPKQRVIRQFANKFCTQIEAEMRAMRRAIDAMEAVKVGHE